MTGTWEATSTTSFVKKDSSRRPKRSPRVLAFQIRQAMKEQHLSKAAMARLMETSRSSLDRLLDPDVPSVTLLTLERAARALGKSVEIRMVDAEAG